MHPYLLIQLAATVTAATLGGAILAQDPRHRAHRLTAAVLFCSAGWAALELIWNSTTDPAWVIRLVRLSSVFWMPLGALCVHLFVEMIGDSRFRLRRFLPGLYALAAVSSLLYMVTPWGIASVEPVSWGWSYRFGAIFPFVYLPPAGLATASLLVFAGQLYPSHGTHSERRQGRWIFAAIGVPLVTASVTDAILPWFGVHVPRLGAASMALVGAVLAWSVHRYGYALVAPGALAPEVLESLREGVVLLRGDGTIRSVNAGLARLWAADPQDLVGRRIGRLIPELADEALARCDDRECELRRSDDSRVPISMSAVPLHDRSGERFGWVLSVRDLGEVVALRNRLILSGRLAAVGELAGGIAHEINNPLGFVQANLGHLRDSIDDLGNPDTAPESRAEIAAEGVEIVDECLVGVARVAAIVRDVRGFANDTGAEPAELDLDELLRTTLRLVRPRLPEGATLHCELGELPPLHGDALQLKHVFLNLLMNAVSAIGPKGTIRIESACVDGDIQVRIEDDGCGMSGDQVERIFDPFYTTRAPGEGVGLGLSLSYQVVQRHGGEIEVASEAGAGTRLLVRLPTG